MSFVSVYRAKDLLKRMMPTLGAAAESSISSDAMKLHWLWSSPIEHEKLLCCQSDGLCISTLSWMLIQLFMCLSPRLHLWFRVRIGWQIWIFFKNFFIWARVCIWLSSAESMVSLRVGRVRWKRKLMNGDSKDGGCGSLKTQARWIELRLTGHCPLSSQTNKVQLHAGGTLYKSLRGGLFILFEQQLWLVTHWWGRALHHHWKIGYHWNTFWIKKEEEVV